jgi:3-isopropylmalate/(R)-2-methylmalate dehydratase large subunit
VPQGALWDAACGAVAKPAQRRRAVFDREISLNASTLAPRVTWGTSPDQGVPIDGVVPDPAHESDPQRRKGMQRALAYMDLQPGQALQGLPISHAFIGSCTNSRIDDLRDAARFLKGRRVAPGVRAMVVPGSSQVRAQAEAEGLDPFFKKPVLNGASRAARCAWP